LNACFPLSFPLFSSTRVLKNHTNIESGDVFMKLWHKVILGLILGILFGYIVGQTNSFVNLAAALEWEITPAEFLTEYIKPIGTIFINLIKMVVIPLIFFSLISGVTSMADQAAFKRVGSKALVVFMTTAAFAVCIGLFFGTVFKPGLGVDLSSLRDISTATIDTSHHASTGLIDMLINIFPSNVFKAMVEDHILQVVVFAIFVAMTMNSVRDRVPMVVEFCHQVAQVVFKLIEAVIKLSPYGVFALTAWVVGTQGFDILLALLKLIFVVLGALFTQYLLFGVMILLFAKLSPMPFYKKMLEPQSIAFSTSSSKATLSTVMRVLSERMGVSKASTSFVLPLGASINMDGTAIYLAICALFFSQAFSVPIDTHHYMILVLTATLGSIGAAGIPGGSLIMMGMVLTSVGLPMEGIALIAGIDRILDMLRTTVNITGDAAVTLIIDKSEGTLDEQIYYKSAD
jgi:Na+/H+-dicarboxylate symporter